MIIPLKTTALAAVLAATTLTSSVPPANANPAAAWWIAGGVAAGALLLGALAYPNWHGAYAAPVYSGTEPLYAPGTVDYNGVAPMYAPNYSGTAPLYAPNNYGTAPLYGPGYVTTALQAWSPEWQRYCQDRYRTFNPRTGYFIDSTGQPHFCGR